MRILGISTGRAFIIEAWGANLHVVHRVDFVLINATPAKNNWGVGRLRKVDLSKKSLHDPQCLGQGTGVELRDWTPHGHDVDVGEVHRKIREEVEDSLEENIQMPMEAWHISTVFGMGSIYKYEVNPVNNMKVCPPCFDYEGASRANTQNSRRTEAPKRDSTVPPTDGNNERAPPADQRMKKPRRSSAAADSSKRNVKDMGMFFLNKPNMKASDIFPTGLIQSASVLGSIALLCTLGRSVT